VVVKIEDDDVVVIVLEELVVDVVVLELGGRVTKYIPNPATIRMTTTTTTTMVLDIARVL
jgi:hypothetical protein